MINPREWFTRIQFERQLGGHFTRTHPSPLRYNDKYETTRDYSRDVPGLPVRVCRNKQTGRRWEGKNWSVVARKMGMRHERSHEHSE